MQETEVLDQLSRSKVYHDFERAFREVTQVPLHLAAPNKRISAQFNRLFRRTVGESPTAFRCSLKGR
jgi:hypothetical protein